MRTSHECAPKRCQCGRPLGKPQYGYPWPDRHGSFDYKAPVRDRAWHIHCPCHTTYVWGWHPKSNGCWRIRSIHPLFDTRQIVVIA